jgi:hypothetical protein
MGHGVVRCVSVDVEIDVQRVVFVGSSAGSLRATARYPIRFVVCSVTGCALMMFLDLLNRNTS